jgi:hypothetical protein
MCCAVNQLRKNGAKEPKEDLCGACKAAITVTAEPKAEACDYFVKVPDPPEMGDEDEVFARNGESAAAQIPKHKSFQEKVRPFFLLSFFFFSFFSFFSRFFFAAFPAALPLCDNPFDSSACM